jgi:hypothetical protein
MNTQSHETITINVTAQLTINRDTIDEVLRSFQCTHVEAVAPGAAQKMGGGSGKLPRLAYSVDETAEILGISGASVRRLIVRGLLRCSVAIRHKMISRTEIERFLKETTRSEW